MQELLMKFASGVNTYLSNYILVFLLVGVGLWYSIKTRFVQVRCFGEGVRKTFGELKLFGGAQDAGMTSFQALATAIAAQVGTGNIVGASGAILTGGPSFGAKFVAICLFFFAFSTVLSWNLFGKINFEWLFGKKRLIIYQVLALVFIFLGTVMQNDLVWELQDMFNNLIVLPNAIALFALTGMVMKSVKEAGK